MPVKSNNVWTAPFEKLHNVKPDYRNLHPMFSIAYVKRFKDGKKCRMKGTSQSIKCIFVGKDYKSDGKLFYLPHTKSLARSADYKIYPNHLSGPSFWFKLRWWYTIIIVCSRQG